MIPSSSSTSKRRPRRFFLPSTAALVVTSFVAGYLHHSVQHMLLQPSLDDAVLIERKETDDNTYEVQCNRETPKKKKKQLLVVHPPYDGPLKRAFSRYPRELPCIPDTRNHSINYGRDHKMDPAFRYQTPSNKEGMFYTKLNKCSSSTLAGVAVQIARNEAKRRNMMHHCLVASDHGFPLQYRQTVEERDKSRSMLWTFIREPAARQVSDFFHFRVSRQGMNPTDTNNFKKEALRGLKIIDYMTGGATRSMGNATNKVAHVMDRYDFIGLVERYHESLILLKLIFNLELRDILYTSAKRSGGYDDGEAVRTCYYIYPSVVTPPIKSWFQTSPEWNQYAAPDILLYRVVNASLDLTVDMFGRQKVERQVKVLQEALEYADAVCGATAVYPCSSTGEKRSPREVTCVSHDWACAYECIETLDLSKFERLLAV